MYFFLISDWAVMAFRKLLWILLRGITRIFISYCLGYGQFSKQCFVRGTFISKFWLHIRGKLILLCQNLYIMTCIALCPTNIYIYSPNKIIHGHSFYMNTYLLVVKNFETFAMTLEGGTKFDEKVHELELLRKTIIFRERCEKSK